MKWARNLDADINDRLDSFVGPGFVLPAWADRAQEACVADMAKYKALTPGISYSDAVSVMGCEGEELSRSDIAGYETLMVMWRGPDGI